MSARKDLKTTIAPSTRRRAWVGVTVAVVVLLAGGMGHRCVDRLLLAADAKPVPLRQPLASLPMQLGAWHGEEVPIDERVLAVAGNDDYISRRYVNPASRQFADVYVAYAARPAKMLGHRPQVCYPAHGWTPGESRKGTVSLPGGGALECLIHHFTRTQMAQETAVVLNYYILGGRVITDWTEFWGPWWRLPNLTRDPNFYVAQVQIRASASEMTPMATAEGIVERLAAEVASRLEAILPAVPTDTR